ncbi:MAG: bifunctional anthranilate synthase component II/anthranilate phosphoribosyltransferase [Spirochaetota bacterium]
MTVIIDNYDSFTYNLFQSFSRLTGEQVLVIRNDGIDIAGLEALSPSRLVISPGPGRPEDAGISVAAIRHFAGRIPILGVCLGHQAIGQAFGASIVGARHIKHGVVEELALDGRGLYRTIGVRGVFTRYHSLAVAEADLPAELEVSARSADGEVMGLRHRSLPIEGVQFHPESIASEDGDALIRAFLNYRREPFAYKACLETLIAGRDLNREEAEAFMEELTDGALDAPRISALLVAFAAKGPAATEIAGCAAVLRRKKAAFAAMDSLTDTCGTGGDDTGSFNISSMAALVAAACGLPIAKHGNRAVSSRSGSADFYEALGVPIQLSADDAARQLEKTNFAFLFAPRYHSAMRHAAPARKALGVKTIMNLVGPLSNPANAAYQVIGVYDRSLLRPVAEAAHLLGVQRVLAVASRDGYDEISPCAPTDMVEIGPDGQVHETVFDPLEQGLGSFSCADLAGGDAVENARLALEIAGGSGRPALEAATAVNAGAALYVAGRVPSIAAGYRQAMEALASGAVADKLAQLRGLPSAGMEAAGHEAAVVHG